MYAHPMAFYDMSDNLKELAAALKRETIARPQILAAVDGSPGSLGAVEYARDLVAAQGGMVVLLNVQPAPGVADARKAAERALCAAKAVLEAAGLPGTPRSSSAAGRSPSCYVRNASDAPSLRRGAPCAAACRAQPRGA